MRTQAERDEQTVTIAVALGLFAVIAVIASVVLGLLDVAPGPASYAVITIVAGAMAIANLIRHRRR